MWKTYNRCQCLSRKPSVYIDTIRTPHWMWTGHLTECEQDTSLNVIGTPHWVWTGHLTECDQDTSLSVNGHLTECDQDTSLSVNTEPFECVSWNYYSTLTYKLHNNKVNNSTYTYIQHITHVHTAYNTLTMQCIARAHTHTREGMVCWWGYGVLMYNGRQGRILRDNVFKHLLASTIFTRSLFYLPQVWMWRLITQLLSPLAQAIYMQCGLYTHTHLPSVLTHTHFIPWCMSHTHTAMHADTSHCRYNFCMNNEGRS